MSTERPRPEERTTGALVVCCSHTGATRRAAQHIASLVGAEIEDIVEWSLHEKSPCACSTNNGQTHHDLRGYDLVIAGASPSNPCTTECVRAFLEAHAGTMKNVAFFFMQDQENRAHVTEEWTKAGKKSPIATVVIPQAEIERGSVPLEIYDFALEARRGLASR